MALVFRLLGKRVGPINMALESRLRSLTLPQIEALADALLDFTAVSDLEAWLSRPPSA